MHLNGKVAVVTGAARGIGKAIAERLADDGADIVSLDLQDSRRTVESAENRGRQAIGIRADVTEPESVAAAAKQVAETFDAVHIIVNNAGLHPYSRTFDDLDYETWKRTMTVNLDSMFLVVKAFHPYLKRSGWGRIINMSSSVVNVAPPGGLHYIASKAGVLGLTRGLATELGPDNITANAIAPSMVDTPGLENMGLSQDQIDSVVAAQAVKKLMKTEDLLGIVSFLCSDGADFLTGQHFHVDGGIVFGG